MQSGVLAGDPPVDVAGHLSHYLAVDLVLQGVVLGGRAKDLVGQLRRMASVFGGVVAHIPQDGWPGKVKERLNRLRKSGNPRCDVGWRISLQTAESFKEEKQERGEGYR